MTGKKLVKKIGKAIRHPSLFLIYANHFHFHWLFSDQVYLKLIYRHSLGKPLNLKEPQTFNEKLQWLKLHDRKPIYTTMVDKAAVKAYVAERIGEKYLIPSYGAWSRFEDIEWDALPEKFVLKTTHDSGGIVLVKDKQTVDREAIRKKLTQSLKRNYFWHCREWPYKNVPPQILAERYMKNENTETLTVYKIFNFNGEPKLIQVIQNDKTPQESIDYFDTEWNLLALKQNFPNSSTHLPKPRNLEKMLAFARLLSRDTAPFLRTDFYEVNGDLYFSEFTFYSDAGLARFEPEEWDTVLGSWLTLPERKNGGAEHNA